MSKEKTKGRFLGWCRDIQSEYKKINWLGKKELLKKTLAVVIMTAILAIFILAMDSFFKTAIGFFISLF